MFTTQSQVRKPYQTVRERPRKGLSSPHREIAFRNEYIATSRTRLLLKPHGDPKSAVSFKVLDDEDKALKFSISGKKYNGRPCREFRDSSGLPLFELHQKSFFTHSWSVSLPGSNDASIAKAAPRWSLMYGFDDFDMSFENQASNDMKEDSRVKLCIERHGTALPLFDIVDGDRKIGVVRESIEHNKTLPFINLQTNKYHPVLEITVTPGMDMSLAAAIAVIVSDWVFR